MTGSEIAAGERGVVRVYGIDLPPVEAKRFAEQGGEHWPLREALGAERLDPDWVETFDVRDLAGLGLTSYLVEGMGVDEDAIAADAGRLDAVEGWVAVLPSSAFGGVAQVIDPGPPLHFLGAWPEAQARPAELQRTPESAAGGLGQPAPPPSRRRAPRRAVMWTAIVAGAVLLAALIVLALV